MGFLPGIFNRGGQQSQQPQNQGQQQGQQGQQSPQGQQQQMPNTSGGAQSQGPANSQFAGGFPGAGEQGQGQNQQQEANPLDRFKDLILPKPVDPKDSAAGQQQRIPGLTDPYLGPFDMDGFNEQVDKADFMHGIDPELAQKAVSGDVQSLTALINSAVKAGFRYSAQMSHGLAEQSARASAERVSGSLDSRMKMFSLRNQNTDNAVLQHPSVAPVLQALKQQIATNNPQMSPQEIHESAESYFLSMSEAMNGQKAAAAKAAESNQQKTQEPGVFDPAKFLI